MASIRNKCYCKVFRYGKPYTFMSIPTIKYYRTVLNDMCKLKHFHFGSNSLLQP